MAIYKIDGFDFDVSFVESGATPYILVEGIALIFPEKEGVSAGGAVTTSTTPLPAEAETLHKELADKYVGGWAETFYKDYGGCLTGRETVTGVVAPPDTYSAVDYVTDVLEQAAEEVGGRATTYDSPQGEESMPKAVQMFNLLYGKDLTPEQGWQFMTILKMVRSSQGEFKRDNYVDEAAYAAFACKAAQDGVNAGG